MGHAPQTKLMSVAIFSCNAGITKGKYKYWQRVSVLMTNQTRYTDNGLLISPMFIQTLTEIHEHSFQIVLLIINNKIMLKE